MKRSVLLESPKIENGTEIQISNKDWHQDPLKTLLLFFFLANRDVARQTWFFSCVEHKKMKMLWFTLYFGGDTKL